MNSLAIRANIKRWAGKAAADKIVRRNANAVDTNQLAKNQLAENYRLNVARGRTPRTINKKAESSATLRKSISSSDESSFFNNESSSSSGESTFYTGESSFDTNELSSSSESETETETETLIQQQLALEHLRPSRGPPP